MDKQPENNENADYSKPDSHGPEMPVSSLPIQDTGEPVPVRKAHPNETVVQRVIENEMRKSYLEYSMSVIVGRALPDVRDGLKPVHRRILHAMNEMGMTHDKPYKKSARIVGETLGKFHPHGDTAVYDSMVRMAQNFSLRYPLLDGQGNWGSVDGDSAASMRYTECRLAKTAEELLQDIDKDTVDFTDNFDGSLKEPKVLPAKLPNLLINGSSGIAVGMATNIPPHNLQEVINAALKLIDNGSMQLSELIDTMPGPDFPTGGIICGTNGIRSAYTHGKGRILVRGKAAKEKDSIIITEIPYMVNKAQLVEQIAGLVKEKIVQGISDIRDESDRDGMRIVIELKQNNDPDVILNQLYKHSRLQTTFGIIMLALVNNEPKVLNLKGLLEHYISHRKDVIRRKTAFELRQAEEKAHILKGLIVALNDIDNVIQKIKASNDAAAARIMLIEDYQLSELQAKAILDMKLQKLASLEQEQIRRDHKELVSIIAELSSILASEQKILALIRNELLELRERYPGKRKTEIRMYEEEDMVIEDLIEDEHMVVTVSHSGYIKRLSVNTYKEQGRGGKGIVAASTKEEDWVQTIFVASTHDYILFFTNKGNVSWLKVYAVPEASRQSRGKAIVNLLQLDAGERITATVPVSSFDERHNLVLVTKKGIVKKTNLMAYSKPRQGGIIAITLDEKDELINAELTDGERDIILATKQGLAIRFSEKDARAIGRTSRGVKGITLRGDDEVIGMVIATDKKSLLTLTENGYGKQTPMEEYRAIGRGGMGVRNIICSERNGNVVAIESIYPEHDIMFISRGGMIIRVNALRIPSIGRNTQGVRLMKLADGDDAIGMAKIANGEKGHGIKDELQNVQAAEDGLGEGIMEDDNERHDNKQTDPEEQEKDAG